MTECVHGYPAAHRCPWCKHLPSDAATTTVLERRGDWNQAAMHALWELAHSGKPFTSEDLTDMIGLPNASAANKNNKVGAFIQRNAYKMRLRRVDQVKARNPQAHGRWLTVWVGPVR